MNSIKVTVVRVYITEGEKLFNPIVKYLKNEVKLRGVSVFRAISGYGETGSHASSLVDLSLDLPLVIEFFDDPEKIKKALEYVSSIVKHEHIVFWDAESNA